MTRTSHWRHGLFLLFESLPASCLSPPLFIMTARAYHCFLGESKLSLSFNAASDVSRVSASVVYNLNLACIFDQSGRQRCPVDVNIPTVDGSYVSGLNPVVSYGLQSDMLLGSDSTLPCQPVFTDDYPFISNPPLETIRCLLPLHTWQPSNGMLLCSRITSPLTSPLITINIA